MSSSTITNPYITENWLHMEKNHDYIQVEAKQDPTKLTDERRKSNFSKRPERRQSTKTESTGLINLSDTFRDTLASGKKQELAKLGLYQSSRKSLSVVTSPPPKHLADPIHHAKRRTSLATSPLPKTEIKRKTSVVHPQLKSLTEHRRASATSLNATNLTKPLDTKRRASVANNKLSSADTLKKTKDAIAQPRRRTLSSGSLLQEKQKTPTQLKSIAAAEAQRRHSLAAVNRTSPRKSIKPGEEEDTVRKKSILAAASLKARQMTTDTDRSSSSTSNESEEEKKKSDLLARRQSRTENMKDGLPASPHMAARFTQRKSQVKQEDVKKALATRTVRKRGKTLPGSLAKPPPAVHATTLPPMTLGPIQLNLPKAKRNSILAKSPSIKARLTHSNKNTPIPSSSCSSSPTSSQQDEAKKSIRKGPRKSVTKLSPPPLKSASPRVPPKSADPLAKRKSTVDPFDPALLRRKSTAPAMDRRRSIPNDYDPLAKRKSTVEPAEAKYDPLVKRKSTAEPRRKTEYDLTVRRKSAAERLTGKPAIEQTRRKSTAEKTDFEMRRKAGMAEVKRELELATARKMSTTEETASPRPMSLHARLQAMAAEHAIDDITPRPETEVRPQKIKDTLRMWDQEMVEAFSPDSAKSPLIALKYYGHYLSLYEQSEIHSYSTVYFLGQHAKKHQATPDQPSLNFGYDDERGDYKSVVNDHLAYRYEILEELGRGSFGQVVKCIDHKLKTTVAVKLIRNKKRFYAQAKTEVRILSDLVRWDPEDKHHNVKMTDHFYFRNHLCIACECLSMNLYELIKVNQFQGFYIPLIRRFTVQILRSLSLLAKHGVIHCDLKPENILLKHPKRSTIKVIDFGSSCLESQRVYTYIQSRFYRSPEIILGLDYTKAIDMWSLGCIIVELYTGVPIFPGENEQEQLACIMEIMGVPDTELIEMSERRHLFFDRRGEPRVVCNSRGKKRRPGAKSLAQVLRCDDPLFMDFIKRCLEWDPTKRMTPEDAFEHEWILQSTKTKENSQGEE
ncbi:kinase-like domain-containing protein [Sporodiniella umbellata]|nr:kinase-like domain-containing protein [Sporodiniella umbellata]